MLFRSGGFISDSHTRKTGGPPIGVLTRLLRKKRKGKTVFLENICEKHHTYSAQRCYTVSSSRSSFEGMKKLAESRKPEHEEKNKSSQLLFGEYARELAVDANTGASKFPILVFARESKNRSGTNDGGKSLSRHIGLLRYVGRDCS